MRSGLVLLHEKGERGERKRGISGYRSDPGFEIPPMHMYVRTRVFFFGNLKKRLSPCAEDILVLKRETKLNPDY